MVNTRFSTSVHILAVLAASRDEAGDSDGGVVPSAEIAERVGSHPAAVRRLLAELKAADLVDVVRGPGGGFRLAVDARDIGLDRLADAVDEGDVFSVHDPGAAETADVDFHVPSAIESINRTLTDRLRTALGEYTLQDVAEAATVRRDLAELVASGLSDDDIREQYEISGGRLVRRGQQ